jgi:hypothetical protein
MICTRLLTHLQRCFMWRLNLIKPVLHERKILDDAEILNDTVRSYVVWRRSQLLCSIVPLISSIITFFVDLSGEEVLNSELNGLGNFLINLSYVANIVIFVAVVLATGIPYGKLRVWSNWRLSSKILRYGFVISFVLPMIPAFVPLKYYAKDPPPQSDFNVLFSDLVIGNINSTLLMELVEENTIQFMLSPETEAEKHQESLEWFFLQWEIGLSNFIKFLPALLSFPAALFAASLRIKGLLPKSSLSSWMLTVAGPFLSLVILAAAMLMIQFYGNPVLTWGVLFLAVGPWLNVFRRGLYVQAPDEDTDRQIDCNQKFSLVFKGVGWILVIIWAIFDYMKGDIQEILKVVKLILEAWGRVLGSTVLFADVLLRMTITNEREHLALRDEGLDEYYRSIEKEIWKKIEIEPGVEWADPQVGEAKVGNH